MAEDGETARWRCCWDCWWGPGESARGRLDVLGDEARGRAGEGEFRSMDDRLMALEEYEGG